MTCEAGSRAIVRGDLDHAERLFERTRRYAIDSGDEISAATARGAVADLLFRRGNLDEALNVLLKEELPVFERLGDSYAQAATMGRIADILPRRGDLDAAREFHGRRLETSRQPGDANGIAATLWSLAQIDLARDRIEEAVPLVFESYELMCRLGREDGIAIVGEVCGHLPAARSAPKLRKLGHEGNAAQVEKSITELGLD